MVGLGGLLSSGDLTKPKSKGKAYRGRREGGIKVRPEGDIKQKLETRWKRA